MSHVPVPKTVPALTTMRRATMLRVIRRNCFAVKLNDLPGVSEVRCIKVDAANRESFEKECQKLEPGKCGAGSPVSVMIQLGQYCMKSRAFVNCTLVHPCTDPVENEEEEGAITDSASDSENTQSGARDGPDHQDTGKSEETPSPSHGQQKRGPGLGDMDHKGSKMARIDQELCV